MNSLTRFIVFLCFCVYAFHVGGQTYPFQKFEIKDGLPHGIVFRVFQDSKGYIWLGTDYGISKFNGQEFFNFTTEEGVLSRHILPIAELEGKIIAGTYGKGICIYEDHKWKPLKGEGNFPKHLLELHVDLRGRLWMMNKSRQLYLFENGVSKKVFEKIETYTIKELPNGKCLFGTSNGVLQVSNNNEFQPWMLNEITHEPIFSICKRGNSFFLGAEGKVFQIRHGKVIDIIHLNHDFPIVEIVNTSVGIWGYSKQSGLFEIKSGKVHEISHSGTFKNIVVNDIFKDKSGNIWVATYGSGLYLFSGLYCQNYSTEQGLSSNFVTDIQSDNEGNVFISNLNELNKISASSQGITTVSNAPDQILSMTYNSREGRWWWVTPFKLYQYEEDIGFSTEVYKPDKQLRVVYQDRKERIWVGMKNGMGYLNSKDKLVEVTDSIVSNRKVLSISQDDNGKFWIGTERGLITYKNGKSEIFTLYDFPGNSQVFDIIHNNESHWVATDKGVFRIYEDSLAHYTTKDGLSHNQCRALAMDDSKNLWVGTLRGVNGISLKNKQIFSFDIQKELTNNEVQDLYFDSKNNSLWIGTVEGLSIVDLDQFPHHRNKPRVHLTQIKTEDSSYYPGQLDVLPYSERSPQFLFHGLYFQNPRVLNYDYRLKGMDKKWKKTTKNVIQYSNLPPGEYVFQVRARVKNTSVVSDPSSIQFSIETPFWATMWFMSLSIFVVVSLIIIITRWIVMRLREKERKELTTQVRMMELEQQALQSLMNPHFIFNAINSIQNLLFRKGEEVANTYLSNFAKLLRLIFDTADKNYISLKDEIYRLELYLSLEKLRFKENLNYEFHIDETINTDRTFIPSMILQPFVENAIWHGFGPKDKEGMVRIRIAVESEQYLSVTVEDNGVGIEKIEMDTPVGQRNSSQSFNSGIKIIEKRLELLNSIIEEDIDIKISTLRDKNDAPNGTSVKIVFPKQLYSLHQNSLQYI